MPRFFIDVVLGDRRYEDPDGADLGDLAEAVRAGRQAALTLLLEEAVVSNASIRVEIRGSVGVIATAIFSVPADDTHPPPV